MRTTAPTAAELRWQARDLEDRALNAPEWRMLAMRREARQLRREAAKTEEHPQA